MKKLLSVLLAVLMCFGIVSGALAESITFGTSNDQNRESASSEIMIEAADNEDGFAPYYEFAESNHCLEDNAIVNPQRVGAYPAGVSSLGNTMNLSHAKYVPTSTIYDSEVITRAEWLHNLVSIFHLSLELQNFPDYYFSDEIDSSYEFYNDILLAVGYGFVDVEAGYELNPDAPLTREFAVQTLGFYVGIDCETAQNYTFSDTEAVTYLDEAQWALESGLLDLVNGEFCPNREVSEAELSALIGFAESYYDSTQLGDAICEYEFADGVIVIPKETEVNIEMEDETYTVRIYNCDAQLMNGDIIAVYVDGIAFAFVVDSVTYNEDCIEISSSEKAEEAIIGANACGGYDLDIEEFEPNTEDQYYVIRNGETAKIEFRSLDFSGSKLTVDYDISIGDGIKGKLKLVIKNLKCDYNISTGSPFSLADDNCSVSISGNLKASCYIEFKIPELLGLLQEEGIKIGSIPVFLVGKVELNLKIALSGQMALNYETDFRVGFRYINSEFCVIKDFSNGSPSISAEAEASVMIEVKFKIDLGVFGGSVAVKFGPKLKLKIETFTDGLLPKECRSVEGYLALEIVPKAYLGVGNWKLTWEPEKKIEIFSKKNSPIRVCYHWEDGIQVFSCTRENAEDEPEPGAGSGSGNGNTGNGSGHVYITSPRSNWYSNGQPSVSSVGQDENDNNITLWEYSENNDGTITITGYYGSPTVLTIPSEIDGYSVSAIGANAFNSKTSLRTVFICSGIEEIDYNAFKSCTSLSSIHFPTTIKEVGSSAFEYCTNLTSVELPEGVETLDVRAFGNCTALTSVSIPSTLTTCWGSQSGYPLDYKDRGPFMNCSSLTDVTIADGIVTIPHYLFAGCTGLQSGIVIPDTVTEIEQYAFYYCENLNYVQIPESVTEIGRKAFEYCTSLTSVELPEGVETLDVRAFGNCTALTSVSIPSTLTTCWGIESGYPNDYHDSGPFMNCSALTNVTLADGIVTIPHYLFAGCTGLQNGIVIPDTVTEIEYRAFYCCSNLVSVTIPNTVTEIGLKAFEYCTSLTSVELPEGVETLDVRAFGNCTGLTSVSIPSTLTTCWGIESGYPNDYHDSGPFMNCSSLTDVTISDGIVTIPQYLFAGCTGLQNGIVIPDTVTEIEQYAFYYCEGLSSVLIPESVTDIKHHAFAYCSSLSTVELPDLVNEINKSTFYGCSSLSSVIFPISIETIGEYAFSSCSSIEELTIPDSVTAIGSYAFSDCTALAQLKLSEGLSTIKSYCFSGCSKLGSIRLPDTVKTIEGNAFEGCTKLTSFNCGFDLETIGNSTFNGCIALVSVSFNYGLRTIGNNAFQGCKVLPTIELPETVTSLGSYAFQGCTKLANVTLSRNLTTINAYTFANCTSLVNIVLPKGIVEIKDHVFYQDTKLTGVTIPITVTTVSDSEVFSYPQKTKIYGCAGSTAETYAAAHNMSFINVTEPMTGLTLFNGNDTLIIDRGASIMLYPYFFVDSPENNTDDIVISSANTGIVSPVGNYSIKGNSIGSTTVTVTTSGGYPFTFNVVVKELTGIEITHLPNKTIYGLNEDFDWSGLVISAVYSDGFKEVLPKGTYDLEGFSATSLGTKTVTASWHNKTASFETICTENGVSIVTFVDWDGTVLSVQQIENGTGATAPSDPEREGYTFTGWDAAFDNITEDITVTAQYTINSYTLTITYQYADGTEAADTYTALLEYGSDYSVNSPEIEGYTADTPVVEGTIGTTDITIVVMYTFDTPGDLNGDGSVNASDAILIMRYALGLIELTPEQILAGDMNGDGVVNASDAIIVMRKALGIIP